MKTHCQCKEKNWNAAEVATHYQQDNSQEQQEGGALEYSFFNQAI